MTILATIAVSFLIGSRIGWLRPSQTASSSQIQQAIPAETSVPAQSHVGTGDLARPAEQSSAAATAAHRANPSSSETVSERKSEKASKQTSNTPAEGELVVYEKGKVIFRMRPDPTKQNSDAIVEASSITKIAPAQSVRLAPEEAETRLLSRTEPQYPPEARAAHRAGNVILEVQVAEDGSVSSIRTVSGDPLLAAAATEAVRTWRYQPYRQHNHASQFQTDVTLTFTLSN
ncbi:MAG: energy transducer TonB [Bryobacteraceae bacterium]